MKYAICAILLSLSVVGFSMRNKEREVHPTSAERLVDEILNRSATIISKKHELILVGDIASMPGGNIRILGLSFNSKKSFSKETLRKLLLDSASELIHQINTKEELRTYLVTFPFTEKNIQIIIYNHKKDGSTLYHPGISSAEISEGVLNYLSIDPEDTFKIKENYQETYEEALRAIQNK